MLLKIYLASLAFGGVLLVASLILGHDGDGDHDFDGHGELDFDVDTDLAAEADAPIHGDMDALGGIFGALKSIRFWTFFTAFFGLTGSVFEGLELLENEYVILALALAIGLIAGATIVTALNRLRAGEHGHVEGASDYVGKSGKVLVTVKRDTPGKLRLEMRGRTVDVLAVTEESEPIPTGEQALVIEMRGATALVTRLEDNSSAEA
jgi:membrane protein implicated in regulation of membrane protease activity